MKKLEEIEKEYESFIISEDLVENLDEFHTYIDFRMDDLKEELTVLKKEKSRNKRYKLIGGLIDSLTCSVIQSNPEFFDDDNEILDMGMKVVLSYKDFYNEILSMATPDNYRELARLAVFSVNYYNEHIDYIEYLRDVLDHEFNGINYFNPKYENNIPVFNQFMRKELDKNKKKTDKPMEKTKKI